MHIHQGSEVFAISLEEDIRSSGFLFDAASRDKEVVSTMVLGIPKESVIDDPRWSSVLRYAILRGRVEFVKILMDNKYATPNINGRLRWLLHGAIKEGQVDIAKEILKRNRDI